MWKKKTTKRAVPLYVIDMDKEVLSELIKTIDKENEQREERKMKRIINRARLKFDNAHKGLDV